MSNLIKIMAATAGVVFGVYTTLVFEGYKRTPTMETRTEPEYHLGEPLLYVKAVLRPAYDCLSSLEAQLRCMAD